MALALHRNRTARAPWRNRPLPTTPSQRLPPAVRHPPPRNAFHPPSGTAPHRSRASAVLLAPAHHPRHARSQRLRKDAKTVAALMRRLTGKPGTRWGPSLIGFGEVRLRYASGRELDWFLVGFAPRKPAMVLYLGLGDALSAAALRKLGPHKRGMGCLYLKSLEGIDLKVLEGLVRSAIEKVRARGVTG